MISITANATTLKIGEVTQVSGVVRDGNGTPIADVPITWSTSPTTVATIASTSASAGVLTAKGVGTATVYAKADTVVRSITITVNDSASTTTPAPSVPTGASGGSYGSATAAELPRVTVNTAYPAAARQIRVPAGANLQAAIDAAQAGDELLLAPGAVYSGNFYLRNKGALNGWITIRTDVSDAEHRRARHAHDARAARPRRISPRSSRRTSTRRSPRTSAPTTTASPASRSASPARSPT